jgi:hypothetical protein
VGFEEDDGWRHPPPCSSRLLFVVLTTLRLRVNRLAFLCDWLDNWTGVGLVAVGMARQGYDLQLTRYGGEGWRATFYPEGRCASGSERDVERSEIGLEV